MAYPIYPASPQMNKFIVQGTQIDEYDNGSKYPFAYMNVGESICIPLAELNEKSVRVCMSNIKARTFKVFKMIKHPELGVAEVGRIA